MKLFEFFGRYNYTDPAQDIKNPNASNQYDDRDADFLKKIDRNSIVQELFDYIVNDDVLHKSYFLPIVVRAKKLQEQDKYSRKEFKKLLVPMINAGAMRHHREFQLKHSPKDLYSKEVRLEVAQKLVDHYFDDISKDEYQTGKLN